MVNNQTCTICDSPFQITDHERTIRTKCAPKIGKKAFPLPDPTLCFSCRLQRRLSFYNCRSLYKRIDPETRKQTISTYSPDKSYTIYDHKKWWSDDWDPLAYGRDFDFNRPFFEQFNELMHDVPQIALAVLGDNVNSDFTNDNYKTKNCYMVFDGERAESSYHGHTFAGLKSCVDFLALVDCELCYECTHCTKCYNIRYSRYCMSCHDSWFLRDCISCKHCFGCANLRQKECCIFNEQKTKEEYEQFIASFASQKQSELLKMKQRAEKFFLTQPVKATRCLQTIDSFGDNLHNCKNAQNCFDCSEMQDCAYCTDCLVGGKDNVDVHIWGDAMERCADSCLIGAGAQGVVCSLYVVFGAESILYSFWCSRNVSNLFGCVALRQKHYCILNKQYSKEEYEKLIPRIIEHMKETSEWGEFFPADIATYGYNETMAQSFYPLEKEEALQQGFKWSDYEPELETEKTINASDLPDDTNDIPDDALNWALICEKSGKPFKLVAQELDFYRKHQLPIPRRHPDQRHFDRFAFKNPYQLWTRKCGKCGKEIQTTYSPRRSEKVYCEECYLNTVY